MNKPTTPITHIAFYRTHKAAQTQPQPTNPGAAMALVRRAA